MAKEETPLIGLKEYLPPNSFNDVIYYLQHHKVHLTITKKRQSILGDYRHAHAHQTHRISVNGNLNKYSFLITLLHELAHLFTFELYRNKVLAHGKEWQNEFSKILAQFLLKKIFPADIEKALLKTLQSPAASSCGDENLLRTLQKYDPKKEGVLTVEQLTDGQLFAIKGQRIFKRGIKIKKRYKCMEIKTGKLYLFSGLYEVVVVNR